MGRTLLAGAGRGWLYTAVSLAALLLAACSSGSARTQPTLAPARSATPPPTASPQPTPATPPAAPGEGPIRWGYDPGKYTGLLDAPVPFAGLPPGYLIESVVEGLVRPTTIAFTPDGRLLVAEQAGPIRVVEDGRLLPEPFFTPDVYFPEKDDQIIELGLVGIAVDPEFARNPFVYVYYTTGKPERRTVVARIRDDRGRGAELREILSMRAAPACCHIAGSLRFAPDGALFVAVGDHQMEAEAQNRGSPFGAILRIRRDGSAPPDNPFFADRQADPRVYAYGLRNPFDLAIDRESGRILATENGFLGQDAIIEVKPGANYGWPGSGLAVPLEQVEPPLLFYHQPIGPAGTEFYRGSVLPAFKGKLLFCQFHGGGGLHAVSFHPDGSVAADTIIARGCTSDVLAGPDGLIYLVDYVAGAVYRIVVDEMRP